MTKKSKSADMVKAKSAKKDEFYTQLTDIEKEMKFYTDKFRDKVVYCNCDDPSESQFFHYFSHNFEHLGLKKLITTGYKNDSRDLFSENKSERSTHLEYSGAKEGNLEPNLDHVVVRHLIGDGDFRSEECIKLLKQADIVVTNPPFSLFREYIAQLIEYEKQFLIIGNLNAITCKEVFPLLRDNKVWMGASIKSGDREFGVPDSYPLEAAGCRTDEKGKKFIRVKGVRWFTNLDHKERHDPMKLTRKYNEEDYPKYDNYNAIEVNKTKIIPRDYKGVMGVPISFIDKYNPDQFEIVGLTGTIGLDGGIKINDSAENTAILNKKFGGYPR